ncbi:hypothetical protein BGX23_012224, partial [Mortierella sp. AD031]
MAAAHLEQYTLAICVRVCRTWKAIFNPFLWRTIGGTVKPTDITRSWRFSRVLIRCAAAGALMNNGHLIQSLRLGMTDNHFKAFMDDAPPTFPQLTSMTFEDLEGTDDLIADFIGRCTAGLKQLSFVVDDNVDFCKLAEITYLSPMFGPKSIKALLEHAPTLEVFRLQGYPLFGSKDIQQLLCSAPNLKELDLIPLDRRYESGQENCSLDARDMVESEWICISLEVFGCQIKGIPRPDITRKIVRRPATQFIVKGTVEESVDLQLKVYSQLARLTKLRELTMGIPYDTENLYKRHDKERFRQYDGLAMSLDSGLDLLKDLKEMRMVGLKDMEVGITNEAEKRWMKENWPNAEVN